jgi:hypothetical protein
MYESDCCPAVGEGPCCADCAAIEEAARLLAGGTLPRPTVWTVRGRDVGRCEDCGTPIYVDQPRCAFCRLLPR